MRVKRGSATRRKHKKVLKAAKGYVGSKSKLFRSARQAVMKAWRYAYKHRKQKKRDFKRLWIIRMGVGAKINGLSYSKLIFGLKKAGCGINRKMLSDMALRDPNSFAAVAGAAKHALA